uniref:Uncharacterized protein n=2 Tax=Anguilla anguilla TaxID=7936 RepID=A0A0E9XJY4_ANGAN
MLQMTTYLKLMNVANYIIVSQKTMRNLSNLVQFLRLALSPLVHLAINSHTI